MGWMNGRATDQHVLIEIFCHKNPKIYKKRILVVTWREIVTRMWFVCMTTDYRSDARVKWVPLIDFGANWDRNFGVFEDCVMHSDSDSKRIKFMTLHLCLVTVTFTISNRNEPKPVKSVLAKLRRNWSSSNIPSTKNTYNTTTTKINKVKSKQRLKKSFILNLAWDEWWKFKEINE